MRLQRREHRRSPAWRRLPPRGVDPNRTRRRSRRPHRSLPPPRDPWLAAARAEARWSSRWWRATCCWKPTMRHSKPATRQPHRPHSARRPSGEWQAQTAAPPRTAMRRPAHRMRRWHRRATLHRTTSRQTWSRARKRTTPRKMLLPPPHRVPAPPRARLRRMRACWQRGRLQTTGRLLRHRAGSRHPPGCRCDRARQQRRASTRLRASRLR